MTVSSGTTTRLLLARHGQAECNVRGRVGGPKTCTGLTALGREQVARLAARLAAEQRDGRTVDVLCSGPRRRLAESGLILAAELGRTMVTEQGLDGPHHGEADGRLWSDVESAFGGAPHAHPDRPYAQGAEPWNDYLRRATAHLRTLLDHHRGQTLLLTVHGETVQAACHLLLDLKPASSSHVTFRTDHASLTCFALGQDRFGNQTTTLVALNDTAHLQHGP
ncbi:histidine phosphatase family protein [Streptomyces griseosporeus]|uniref:histidine phosphatase family protein n=1 Tax=Streptomyces griseosporeus TaxID=1910 RepID=UPI0036FC5404